jgi:protein-L-isoaspartate(D-aspartate) O-methyltransferase
MVAQLRHQGIQDPRVLQTMATVKREQFVEPTYRDLAYADFPLPIGHQQTISQPYIVAYMTQAADIAPEDIVLEIGTGSGYQAAVLAELAQAVYTVEIQPTLARQAQQRLKQLNYSNVQVKTGDGYQRWAEHAPYDAILVTAAPERVPEPLLQQLALEGKLVIPVGKTIQNLLVIQKTADSFLQKRTLPVQFVPMTGQSSRS